MEIDKYKPLYFEEYFGMAKALFPDYSQFDLKKDLERAINSVKEEAFFAKAADQLLGFVHVSVRTDYVEGATSTPVGYLEAVYVKPAFRNQGIAVALCQRAEAWAIDQGCTQMGSDTWATDKIAIAFHHKIGFREDDVLIHFIKDI